MPEVRPVCRSCDPSYELKECRSRRNPSLMLAVGIAPYPNTIPGRADLATVNVDNS
ncbi:MAG: hypothetical protein ACRD5Z_15200 [Bryobacteraceae bacterium]